MTATYRPAGQSTENAATEMDPTPMPLFSVLDRAARDYPNQAYTLFNGAKRTFAQVKDASDRLARFLSTHGIEKGDRIAVALPNTAHFPIIFFGILKAGAICVNCNPLYTSQELHYQLNDAGAKAVFCMDHPEQYPRTVEAVKNTDVATVVICNIKSTMPKFKAIIHSLRGRIPAAGEHEPDHLFLDQVVESARPEPPEIEIDPMEDPAVIIYTAGTTGMPKGATLTHNNLVYDLRTLEAWVRLPHEHGGPPEPIRKGGFHTYMGIIPWYQSFGMTVCMLAACWSGSRLICIPEARAGDPPFTEALSAIHKHKPTLMPAVPTLFTCFTKHPRIDEFKLTSLMGCFSGGAPLPAEVCREFEAKTGAVIFEGYGLSETGPVITSNPTARSGRKIGTVGFPLPGTDIRILDMESGSHEMPAGTDGEIAVCGPQVMKGYWQRPDETRSVFREIDGKWFFLTGDIGHFDEEGYLLITDRKKDMIIVGGFNVYPKEIENTLFNHPKIEMAAVVGVPDSESGEAVKAHVQLKQGQTATEEEILAFCRERLSSFKCPKIIEFREEMPVSPGGKLQRRHLREDSPLSA